MEFLLQIIVFVFVFLTVVVCCCRKEEEIHDEDEYHNGDVFMMFQRGSFRRGSNTGTDGVDPKERRQHISKTIITKTVIETTEKKRRRSIEFGSFVSKTPDSPKLDKSPPREREQNTNDRVYSSFASALSKSQRSVKFASRSDDDIESDKEESKIADNDKEAITSSKNSTSTPLRQKPLRRKSNIIARRLSWTLGSFGKDDQPTGCNICLMDFEIGEEIGWSPNPDCIHAFHKECIVDWLMVKNECPICRRDYLNEKVNDIEVSGDDERLNEAIESIGSIQDEQV